MARGPIMGGGGGFRYDGTNERNQDDEQTSQALNRGDFKPGFIKDSTSTFKSAQSKEQADQVAYSRDAGHTQPQMSRREQADMARLQEDARNIPEGIKPPSQQQTEQTQAQQTPQRQQHENNARPQEDVRSLPVQDTRQTPQQAKQAEQQRQFDLSAKVRGKLDALEANGGEKFGDRRGFGSERMLNIATESYQKTTQDIQKGKFGDMSDRARAAAGHGTTQEQGQSQSAGVSDTPSANPRSRFGGMADRARAASQATQTEATKKDGLEQR